MKIITYSDMHLEFGRNFQPPADVDADVMILAGDMITFRNFEPLGWMLKDWHKPVLFVAGKHEYYTQRPMDAGESAFKAWLAERHPNVTFLQDESITIDGVHFFGGTMWTDFNGTDHRAMMEAANGINDYRQIMLPSGQLLKPIDTVAYHASFVTSLEQWFAQDLSGKRVVISHHAPVVNPNTQYGNSPLMPAFNSLDMVPLIEKYQPALWVYGHTHECDDQMIGRTRIISNQRGYPNRTGGFECAGFDKAGLMVEV
jgi:Icc-related predicted phosphoesterase